MQPDDFTLESLLLDTEFIRWVKDPMGVQENKWARWALISKENAVLLDMAKLFVRQFLRDSHSPLAGELETLWEKINMTNVSN